MTGTQAYELVKRYGTRTQIETAARYLAYGRAASVRAMLPKIAALYSLA